MLQNIEQIIQNSKYESRLLTIDDLPQIGPLYLDSFGNHNDTFKVLGMTPEKSQILLELINWKVIFDQQLSFGQFKDGKLASFAIIQDYKIDYFIMKEEALQNECCMKFITLLKQLTQEYKEKEKNTPVGELLYLYILATDPNHFKNHLALISLYQGVQKAKKQGFKRFVTESAHIGTHKSVERTFNGQIKIFKELIHEGAKTEVIEAEL